MVSTCSAGCDCGACKPTASSKFGNPNPKNFKITKLEQVRPDWCVVEVQYPDSKNYEGNKIMLYNSNEVEVRSAKSLDPHFCEHPNCLSPVARFEPTAWGWYTAVFVAMNADAFVVG